MTDLSAKVKQVPRQPGVYLFRDKNGKILYIGKARVLRDRVRTYFQRSTITSPRILSMMSRAQDLEWIITGTEVEALLTEANLVRQYAPKYNVNLKDDKSFPYIRITNEPYPQVLLTREIVHDGSKYFGPYTEVKSLRETLRVIHKVFPIRSCSYKIDRHVIAQNRISVCLDYHIKKCTGPCEGMVSWEEYNSMIKDVVRFLHGSTRYIIRDLKAKMEKASEEMRYEEAALYRDQAKAVQAFIKRQRKVTASFDDKDIIAIAIDDNDACAVVIRLRNGRIIGREKVFLAGIDRDNEQQTLSGFMHQFYLETDFIPGEIILPAKPEDEHSLAAWLREKRGKRVALTVPQRGEKVRLQRIAYQNAQLLLEEHRRRKARRKELVPSMVQQLQNDLRLSVPPRRIEAFDISHIQGANPVASVVCFVDGVARKSAYRKFKIKTVKGIDDFAMMREVVFRRYKRLKSENAALPDLIVVDGGKGQLGMAVSALRELDLTYIPVLGLAKRLEEVFLPGYSEPQSIPKSSPGLILLRRIRDEAHRFAITFHRQRQIRSITTSIFDEIKGVGPVTRKRLFAGFGNVQSIANSSVDEIARKARVSPKIAEDILSKARAFLSESKRDLS